MILQAPEITVDRAADIFRFIKDQPRRCDVTVTGPTLHTQQTVIAVTDTTVELTTPGVVQLADVEIISLDTLDVSISGAGSSSFLTHAGLIPVILCDCTAGDVVIDLPPIGVVPAVSAYFKKTDSTINNVIINADGSDTIDGVATVTLPRQPANANRRDCILIHSDGTALHILSTPL